MWCPKCKTEYKEGIFVCADCGTTLIEELGTADYIDICEIKDEKTADEILEFFEYSKVKGAVKEETEDGSAFRIVVPEKSAKQAEKMFHGYLIAKEEEKEEQELKNETEEQEAETASDELEANETGEDGSEEASEDALFTEEVEENTAELLHEKTKKEYVKKEDQYKDMKFSGITFLVFGVLGFGYLALSKLKLIPISYHNPFAFWVIAALFVGFLIAGVVSMVKSGKLKKQIPEEQEKIEEINGWMEEHVTDDMISGWKDASVSDSENDLLAAAHIKTLLMKEYPGEPVNFLELLADEYYEEHFVEE